MQPEFPTRSRGIRLVLWSALLWFLAMTFAHGYSQDYSAWTHHADFRVNSGPSGAALTQDIADFPLLLRLDSANFAFAEAKVDGADIRFSGPGGLPLAYEIEWWDSTARKAEVWIRLPLIKAGTDTGSFRMHWGNPAAPDASDSKAVFDAAGGFKGVWHLSWGAVRDAVGASDDGDASLSARAEGLIAEARLLQGKNEGILVANGPGVQPGGSLSVSLWINADTWAGKNHHIVHKGDGKIEYALYQEGDSLIWALGLASGAVVVKTQVPATGGWRHIAGTFDGLTSRLYVDGMLAASLAVTGALVPGSDHLGLGCRLTQRKSHENFEGRLDEIVLADKPRTGEWIKLAYLTQKAGANIVSPPVPVIPKDTLPKDTIPKDTVPRDTLPKDTIPKDTVPRDTVPRDTVPTDTGASKPTCTERFAMPLDTTVGEGETINLTGIADCATGVSWSVAAGPAPRIFDPDVKALHMIAPRVTHDTPVAFRFTATFGETQRSGVVVVTLRETIPDPLFDMPKIAAWNGKDPLVLRPTILNHEAIKVSKAPNIRFEWTLDKVEVESELHTESLFLKKAHSSGTLEVKLCLDNGGPVSCQLLTIPISLPVGIRAVGATPGAPGRPAPAWDAAGRRLPAPKSVESKGCCGIIEGLLPFGGYRGKEMASRPEGENPPGE